MSTSNLSDYDKPRLSLWNSTATVGLRNNREAQIVRISATVSFCSLILIVQCSDY